MNHDRRPDPLADALRAYGLVLTDHTLSGHFGSLYIGPRFRIRHCEIIYRRPDPGVMLIVLYRRLTEKTGTLGNPFADLLWFLQLCTQPDFGLQRILCCISTDRYRHENGLSGERMVRFCRQILNAEWTEYDGHRWLYQDAEPLRQRLAQIKHRFARLPKITTVPAERMSPVRGEIP